MEEAVALGNQVSYYSKMFDREGEVEVASRKEHLMVRLIAGKERVAFALYRKEREKKRRKKKKEKKKKKGKEKEERRKDISTCFQVRLPSSAAVSIGRGFFRLVGAKLLTGTVTLWI